MNIRPATSDDHEDLIRIMRESIRTGCREAYGVDVVETWTADGNTVFPFDIPERTLLGEENGRMLGFCSWVPQTDDASKPLPAEGPVNPHTGYARINRLFLSPEAFRTGLGRNLLAATEKAAQGEGFRQFILWSSKNAVAFYEKAGYRHVAAGRESVPVSASHKVPVFKMYKTL